MDWRDMPPLAALRAFEAFAEAGDVVRAGERLNVSHAAISQQLRALERHLNVGLVDRSGRALQLTEDGRRLAQALSVGFGAIYTAVQDISGAGAARPVHVSTTPSFAANWLMPRFARFRERHPGVNLMIDPSPAVVELKPGGIDVALRHGIGPWPGMEAEMLVQASIVLVGAPVLVGDREFESPAEMTGFTWLEELGTSEATTFLRGRNVPPEVADRRVQMPGNLVLDAARNGQGVAVTTTLFVEGDVAAGRLRILFREPDNKSGYHIVTRPGVQRPGAREFIQWLRRQGREEREGQMTSSTPSSESRST